ncbi:MAG TPA: hypothetical protein DDX84_05035 [Nitrospiraceae bacterium]|nr:hypothetical protein [Nitrospiraceae bacterium]
MKWKDIVKKHKNEWVLIEPQKVDENFNIQDGKIIAHSKDKSEIYERLLTSKRKSAYIEYTGKIPDDLAVVLIHEEI